MSISLKVRSTHCYIYVNVQLYFIDNEIEVPTNCLYVLVDKPLRESGHSYSFYLYENLTAWEPCTELTKVGVNKVAIFSRIQYRKNTSTTSTD